MKDLLFATPSSSTRITAPTIDEFVTASTFIEPQKLNRNPPSRAAEEKNLPAEAATVVPITLYPAPPISLGNNVTDAEAQEEKRQNRSKLASGRITNGNRQSRRHLESGERYRATAEDGCYSTEKPNRRVLR
jgi:hypothetical protein